MKNHIQKGSFKYLKSYYATVAVLLMITTFTSVPVFADSSSLEKILPAPRVRWVGLGDKISLYTKDNLFGPYRRRGGDVFPVRFRSDGLRRYISKQNTQYAVEADVYKMGSPLDAFGNLCQL